MRGFFSSRKCTSARSIPSRNRSSRPIFSTAAARSASDTPVLRLLTVTRIDLVASVLVVAPAPARPPYGGGGGGVWRRPPAHGLHRRLRAPARAGRPAASLRWLPRRRPRRRPDRTRRP